MTIQPITFKTPANPFGNYYSTLNDLLASHRVLKTMDCVAVHQLIGSLEYGQTSRFSYRGYLVSIYRTSRGSYELTIYKE
jgi:hypothetical protein